MTMDEKLSGHVRAALADAGGVSEVKMFGGIGFMLNGNMVAAASQRGLLLRVGKEGEAEALARPGATVMVMNGRTMNGYIRVAPSDDLDRRSVAAWLRLARAYVETLPPKSKAVKAGAKSGVAPQAATKRRSATKQQSKRRKP